MAFELQITGSDASQIVRKALTEGETMRLGRGSTCTVSVPWEVKMSRQHADLVLRDSSLEVSSLEAAPNPFAFQGAPVRQARLTPGDKLVIGGTTLTFMNPDGDSVDQKASDTNPTDSVGTEKIRIKPEEHSFSLGDLSSIEFGDAPKQLEALSRLPELIAKCKTDVELAGMICRLLLEAIPQADAVAAVRYDERELSLTDITKAEPTTMRVETREDFTGRFLPSRRLIYQTLKQQNSTIHIWSNNDSSGSFTITEGLDWAFAAPIRAEACRGWALYVSGSGSRRGPLIAEEEDLAGDLRFAELVAQFIGSVRQVRMLQDEKTRLSVYFSPKVIESLTDKHKTSLLEPAERDITILFCDVRGFSRISEKLENDLHRLLDCVRAALGVMTGSILQRDGAIADFQGDAAMGFWGWPVQHESGPLPACQAALVIQREFRTAAEGTNELLADFSVGIGISHGRALAGQIGTSQQAKIGVFGPVVNQCARLESMTKQMGTPILVDDATAQLIADRIDRQVMRLRPVARVRPKGMATPVLVHALLPSEPEMPEVSRKTIKTHKVALDLVTIGEWSEAMAYLETIPADDGPATFLRNYLETHNFEPPDDWDGAIKMMMK